MIAGTFIQQRSTRMWQLIAGWGRLPGRASVTLRRLLLIGLAVLALVVSGAFTGLLLSTDQLHSASDRRGGSEQIIAKANRTESLLLDLETGERGFVITGLPAFLQPWRAAVTAFPASARRLVALVRANPSEKRIAAAILKGGTAYIDDWTRPLIAAERRDPPRARELTAAGRGKREVDALRQLFGRLTAAEQRMEATRTADADRSAAQASDFAIAGLLGSLLVIGVLAVFLGRSLVTPLGRLGAAADRMASGDLSARVSPRGPVELAELAYSFNAMAEALERGQAELVEASKQADQANHAKSEFLSRMSHELRTPLNAVLGFGQLLEMEGLDDRQQEYVGYVLKGGKHLLALIDEVLELSRIETGQLAISPEPVPLGETVNEVVTLVKPLAAEKHVEISADLSGLTDDGHVHADRQRLKQVLLNLLSNAIKYNRPDGRVQITLAKSSEGRVRIVVDDTGIGIPPDRLAAAFEPFERLGAELTEIEGTGLGLALSKRLVEAMGGSITIRSEPGSGTTFTVELDAVAPPDAIDGAGSTPQRPHVTGGEAGSQRILYVEDNLSNLKLVERVLDGQPAVELVPAMMAMLGLELAREHRPDLIVLDLHLPDMPGEQLLQRLKADAATATIPVIVLTADATKRQREHLLQLGALEYLTKPLDVHRFLDVVASALGWTPSE